MTRLLRHPAPLRVREDATGLPTSIELFGRTFANKAAQPAQGHLDVAGAEFDAIVEIAEFALVPDFYRAPVPAFVLADAHAFRIVAIGAEGRGAGRANPLVAALVALLLLGEA